jgi:hypothetical protein
MPRGIAIVVVTVLTGEFLFFPSAFFFLYIYGLTMELRHEMPVKNELSKQNIQDRFFGQDDPVARKILAGHAENQGLKPPEDQSVVSPHYFTRTSIFNSISHIY